MRKPDGLHSERVFSAENILVGRCPGEPYGYKQVLPVTVSVCMERLSGREACQTVNHEKIARPLQFTITTEVWQPQRGDTVSSGITVEPLLEVTRFAKGYDEDKLIELARLGRWHMNTMSAACAHQARSAGLDSAPCPVTGYQWGHAWLVRPLPDGFLDKVKALFDLSSENVWDAG